MYKFSEYVYINNIIQKENDNNFKTISRKFNEQYIFKRFQVFCYSGFFPSIVPWVGLSRIVRVMNHKTFINF